ncbi:MAG TPA: hypothetical protein VF411_14650 [Bacteroidia bacterium]
MENKITEDHFDEYYKPQVNHLVKDASFNGCMYETYGIELSYIRSLAHSPLTDKRVWTILETDGKMSYAAGYHFVNLGKSYHQRKTKG